MPPGDKLCFTKPISEIVRLLRVIYAVVRTKKTCNYLAIGKKRFKFRK